MAKKGKKGGKLPKKLAGVKIPKTLRKEGAKLGELVKHPLVADLVAAGLVALAAKVGDSKKVQAAAGKAGDAASDAAGKTRDMATELGQGAALLATMLANKASEKLRDAAKQPRTKTDPDKTAH